MRDSYNEAYEQARIKVIQQMELLPARRLVLLQDYHQKTIKQLQSLNGNDHVPNLRVSLIKPLNGRSPFE